MSEKISNNLVTIVFVQRERFSCTAKGLESLIAHTNRPHQLICVNCNSPDEVRGYLKKKCDQLGGVFLHSDIYLTPNEARNAAMKYVSTRYVAFVDNDIEFTEGWLDALVNCAEETGAWLVGPLYLEADTKGICVHMYGGDISIVDSPSGKDFDEDHYLVKEDIEAVADQLLRKKTRLLEFHTMLVRRDVLEKLGPLEPGLMNVKDHSDLCYSVAKAGGLIYLEPTARIIYKVPNPDDFDDYDRDYFCFRWSHAWTRKTIRTYCKKYGINTNSPGVKIQNYWCNKHRRKISAPFTRTRKLIGEFLFNIIDSVFISPIELYFHKKKFSFERCVKSRKPIVELIGTSLHSQK
jgi:GT2 family glycosyltransferase